MSLLVWESLPRLSVKALLAHLGEIDDPREPWRVAHPLSEVLLLVVCATVCDCDDYDAIADWGEVDLDVLRHLPCYHGVPCGRWLTLLMNRIDPNLFAQVFTDWVRATWSGRPDLVAIDGKTSRRSHDRSTGTPPLHTVSAHKCEEPGGTTPVSRANQAAVQERVSRSSRSCLFSRRRRASSSRSVAVRAASAVACFGSRRPFRQSASATQFRMAWSDGSN